MKKYSLTKREILTSETDFKKVFFKGKRLRSDCFEIRFITTASMIKRLGVSVSKRTGNAVRRNKIKRIIREWFRTNKHELIESIDIIFLIRKKLDSCEIKILNQQIHQILVKEKILNYQ